MKLGRSVLTAMTSISGLAILAMMVIAVSDVVLRSVAAVSLPGAVEYTEVILVIVVFIGLVPMQVNGYQVVTEVLYGRVSDRARRVLDFVGDIVTIAVLTVLTYSASSRAIQSITIGEFSFGLLQVPLWPARLAIAVGSLALLGYFLAKVVRGIRGGSARAEADPTGAGF